MRTLDNNFIREIFNVKKDIPIYHTDDELVLGLVAKNKDLTVSPVKDRPFDFMVTSVFCKASNGKSDYYFLTYFEKGDYVTNRCVNADNLKVVTDFDETRDMEKWFYNMTLITISIFEHKQTKIYLSECSTKRLTSKGKTKQVKQRVKYISTDKIIRNYNSISSGVKRSFSAHLVSGHWRYYKSNPKTKGHDRDNKNIIGKTWIPAYPKGDTTEIMETIRHWR